MDFPHGGAAQIWRDLEAGLAHLPVKSQIRAWGAALEKMTATGKAMDGAYLGLVDSPSIDQRDTLQDAINIAAYEGAGALILPGGRIISDGPVYCFYDGTLNPDFTDLGAPIPFKLSGLGHTNRAAAGADVNVGATVLEFANLTGDGLVFGGAAADRNRSVVLRNMAVFGGQDGALIKLNTVPQNSLLENLYVRYTGAGVALHLAGVWSSTVRCVELDGVAGQTGVGLWLDGTAAGGGGMNVFDQITASYFEVGLKFGSTFSAGTLGSRANVARAVQGRYCDEGLAVLFGVELEVIGSWFEENLVCDVRASDTPNSLTLRTANFGSTAVSEGSLVLGRSTGTDDEKAHGPITLDGSSRLRCGVPCGIRRYAHANPAAVRIENVEFLHNGGVAISVDDDDPGGFFLGPQVDFSNLGDGLKLENASGAPAWWLSRGGVLDPAIADGTTDLTDLVWMPQTIRCATSGGGATVLLPAAAATFKGFGLRTDFRKIQSANNLVLDAGTGNTIKGSQTYTITAGTAYKGVSLIPVLVGGSAIMWDVVGEW